MGKVNKAPGQPAQPDQLVLRLDEPGLTSILRAGVGGVAASLYAISLREKGHSWPTKVGLGPGFARVEPHQIVFDWSGHERLAVFEALSDRSFAIQDGLVFLPGVFGPHRHWNIALGAALQGGLKRTFLQHGMSTTKQGGPRVVTMQPDDDVSVEVSLQPYGAFAHQKAASIIDAACKKGGATLAGWAYPGAVMRHEAYGDATKWLYSPSQVVAALFAIVGCLSYQVTSDGGAGAFVIPEPADLVEFGAIRGALTPARPRDVYVAGASDAVLSAALALKAFEHEHPAISAMHGVSLRSTPWATQQKNRVRTMRLLDRSDGRYLETLETYERVTRELPARVVVKAPPPETKKGGGRKGAAATEFFVAASGLRGFLAENLAQGLPWHEGFATAKVGVNRPRWLHQMRQKDNLGALLPSEKKGLRTMVESTNDPEKLLITSVHTALRQRFGAIAEETKGLSAQARKNRWNSESERWRLAFAKAKTPQQVRSALADLWSRAGRVRELQESWAVLLPLLQTSQWSKARDLALVALASYQGKGAEVEGTSATGLDDDPEQGVQDDDASTLSLNENWRRDRWLLTFLLRS